MPIPIGSPRTVCGRLCLFVIALVITVSHAASGQDQELEGYITAVHLPGGFDVNGKQVSINSATCYGLMDTNVAFSDGSLRDEVNVGAYVRVVGTYDYGRKQTNATTVLFRDDRNQKLVGSGVIIKVDLKSAEPIYQADGYIMRVPATAETSFEGDGKSLADVRPNTWVRYEGKRDNDGVLIASKIKFLNPRRKPAKKHDGGDELKREFEAPDLNAHKDGGIKFTRRGDWHTIPADPELQARIQRVGMRVVPEFQKRMAEDDPDKIAFSFWAVDDGNLRGEFCSSHGGLIVISRQTMERLQNDDQLAAVLADGVAYEIQREGAARLITDRRMLGADTASLAIFALSPGTGLLLGASGGLPSQKHEQHLLEEQRGRLALSLLADGGFDPRQAPEAWRLLEPKHLPADLNTLKYPNRSWYQLSFLNMQYPRSPSAGSGANGSGE